MIWSASALTRPDAQGILLGCDCGPAREADRVQRQTDAARYRAERDSL